MNVYCLKTIKKFNITTIVKYKSIVIKKSEYFTLIFLLYFYKNQFFYYL